jgi:hypothetical protein
MFLQKGHEVKNDPEVLKNDMKVKNTLNQDYNNLELNGRNLSLVWDP